MSEDGAAIQTFRSDDLVRVDEQLCSSGEHREALNNLGPGIHRVWFTQTADRELYPEERVFVTLREVGGRRPYPAEIFRRVDV
jgi:hypothetical protein